MNVFVISLSNRSSGLIVVISLALLSLFSPTTEAEDTFGIPITPRYDKVSRFSGGFAAVKNNGGWGLINRTGRFVIDPRFDALKNLNNGRVAFRASGKWGMLNKEGETIVEPVFNDVRPYSGGLAPVRRGGHWGYVDRDGDTKIPFEFSRGESFSEGLAVVTKNGRKGFIDSSGRFVIEPRYQDAHGFSGDLAAVEKNDFWGYIDKRGAKQIDFRFNWAAPFHDGIARVRHRGQWGLIDRKGNLIGTYPYDLLHNFFNGRALFRHQGKVGYLNRAGNVVIEPKYEAGGTFNQGLAPVKKNGKWGFIDKSGEWVLAPEFQLVSGFHEDRSAVKAGGQWGYLGRVDRTDTRNFSVSRSGEDQMATVSDLHEPLTNDFPTWRNSGGDDYVSIGRGLLPPEWHIERLKEVKAYGNFQLLYEVTRFPYELPTFFQREASNALVERSLQAVKKQGWGDRQKALQDGYEAICPDCSHHYNKKFLLDDQKLVPARPEYLIYYTMPDGRDVLAGFMFHLSSMEQRGPQIGGPMTEWHKHVFGSPQCLRFGISLVFPDGNKCPNGTRKKKEPSMLHVWFGDHPRSRFSTFMSVPKDVLRTSPFF